MRPRLVGGGEAALRVDRPDIPGKRGVGVAGVGEKDPTLVVHHDAGAGMGRSMVRDRILTERGGIREHVNVFVGKTEARSTGVLAAPLADGMEISILPAISGGQAQASAKKGVA